MLYTEKGTVEDFIVQELKSLRWKYVEPQAMNEKRKGDFEQPLVVEDLRRALRRVNSSYELADADLDYVVTSLRTIPANIEGIRVFLDRFRNGFVVPLQKEGKERVVKLVDLENGKSNEFIVTRQFKVEGLKTSIRADVVLLVNGVPLVLVECKSPTAEEVTWLTAYKDIKEYEEKVPELFKFVQFSIATDGNKTYHFPNAFNEEGKDFLSIWRDPYPFERKQFKEDTLRTTLYGLLSKRNLMNILENFIFVRIEKGKPTKIMPRYMQFRAAERICQRVIDTLKGKEKKKFGLIWHWQGSGKTYTMAFAAWKLLHSVEAKSPSIFVMVDRRKLEGQIEDDFAFLNIPVERVETINQLYEFLRWGNQGKRGIFLVTIEKFSPKKFLKHKKREKKRHPILELERENIVVLADEVHRTHYGKFRTVMTSIFKNALIFGFTGTPLSRIERNTFQKFCPEKELYLDRYSMMHALTDGFTVPLSYQARMPDYHLKEQELKHFVKFEEEEIQPLPFGEKRELRKKVKVIKEFVKDPDRIKSTAEDLALHFREIVEPTDLKAMIVTIDREACVKYKNALDELLPSNYSEIVMTFGSKEKLKSIRNYWEKLQEEFDTSDYKTIHAKIIEDFKTTKERKILIVTDMLITGFDAPILWTMYLDRPLKEHRILQAIARTNRPFSNKKFGLIVDYIGILTELEAAFQKFEARDAKDLKVIIRKLDKENAEFKKLIKEALAVFAPVKRENTYESLQSALDILIDLETAKKFEVTMRKLMRSYEMLRGDPFLAPYLLDYTWLVKIYVAYYKRFRIKDVDELKVDQLSKKTIHLIQETIDVKGIDDSYPTVAIDEEYIRLLKKKTPKNIGAAIDMFPPVFVEVRNHPNSPFFINLGEEIEITYEKLRTRKLETAEAVQQLVKTYKRIVEWKDEEKEIGKDKYPIYEAMKLVIPKIEKERSMIFINKLIAHLRSKNLLFKDWQSQRDIRRKVRAETRLMLLGEFKDHKGKIDDLTEGVFTALEGIRLWKQ